MFTTLIIGVHGTLTSNDLLVTSNDLKLKKTAKMDFMYIKCKPVTQAMCKQLWTMVYIIDLMVTSCDL